VEVISKMYTEQLQKYFKLAADILREKKTMWRPGKKKINKKKKIKNWLLSLTYHQYRALSF